MSVAVKEMGSLADRSAFELLRLFCDPERQGVVVFASNKEKISIIIQKGFLLVPKSLLSSDQLMQRLFQKGMLNNEDFIQIQQLMKEKNWSMPEALANMEVLSTDQYQQWLQQNLEDAVFKVLSWTHGKYAIVEDLPSDTLRVSFETSLSAMLFAQRVALHQQKPPALLKQKVQLRQPSYKERLNDYGLDAVTKRVLQTWEEVTYGQSLPKLLPDLDPTLISAIAQTAMDFHFFEQAPQQAPTDVSVFDMQDTLKNHAKMNFYELIGLPETATTDQAKKQYLVLAKQYHPDRIKKDVGIDHAVWGKVFGKMTEAYQTLSHPAKKKAYDEKRASGGRKNQNLDAKKILASEGKFLDGMDFLRRGQFEEAEKLFEKAIDLYSDEYEYFVHLGWAKYRSGLKRSDDQQVDEGTKLLKKAISKARALDDVYYYNGMIQKMNKDYKKALVFFNKALEENKFHQQALQERNATAMLVSKGN